MGGNVKKKKNWPKSTSNGIHVEIGVGRLHFVIFALQRCSHSNDRTSRLVRQRTARFDVILLSTQCGDLVSDTLYKTLNLKEET